MLYIGYIALAASLDVLKDVVTYVLSIFSSMSSTLLSTPLFLISVAFFVVGGSIGLVKRIIS